MSWLCCPSQYLSAGVIVVHVIPLDDLKEHEQDICCWCTPTCSARDKDVIVHNAADGREQFETGERLMS